jgi:hypothetical protein
MKLTRIFTSRVRGCLTRLCLLFAVAACAATASGRATPRVTVETNKTLLNYPVELVGPEVSGVTHGFTQGEPPGLLVAAFDAPGDWLRHFVLKIRNKSDKTILSARLDGSLAVGEGNEIPAGFDLMFGQELDESAFTGRPPRGTPDSLAPGQTGEVRWSEAEYARLEKLLSSKHAVADFRRMRIYLREVRFADGTVWTLGGLFRIDPLDPRKWTPVDGPPKSAASAIELKPGERIVEVSSFKPDFDPDVLLVTGIEVAGHTVTPGQPFTAGDDWLRGLTVRFRNISAKPITYVQLGFSFPEAHYHDGGLAHTLRYGSYTAGGEQSALAAKMLLPGEEAEMIFTGSDYDAFRGFAEKLNGSADFHRLRMGLALVKFEDGTRATVFDPTRKQKPGAPAAKSN